MLINERGYAGIITSMRSYYSIYGSYLYEKHRFVHYKVMEITNMTGYSDTRPLFSDDASIIYYNINVINKGNKVKEAKMEVSKFDDKLHFYVYAEMEKMFKPMEYIVTDVELIIHDPGLKNLEKLIRERRLYFIENSNYPVKKFTAIFKMPLPNFDVEVLSAENYNPGDLPDSYVISKEYMKFVKSNSVVLKTSLKPKIGYFFVVKGSIYESLYR
jgi:hypothetical protein